MFLVVEIQKQTDGTISNIVTQHEEEKEALSKYYAVLSYAAVSSLPQHACVLLTDKGEYCRNEFFVNEQAEPTNEEETN